MHRLVVNADDFGLTTGVNRAIIELHGAGVLTSTTLMARAGATEDAIELALANPSLGVGCHVVLVDGDPMLPAARDLPNLAHPATGRFEPTLLRFLARIHSTSSVRKIDYQIEREVSAQIESLLKRGVRLTHIDTHKHTHMFPRVLRPVLRAARAAGIRLVRNPFEPEWAVHATPRAGWLRSAEVWALRRFGPFFRRILAEEGFSTTEGTIAVAGTGSMDGASVRTLLEQMPPGTFELVTHPGYNDADLAKVRTRLRESRDVERGALPVIREFPGIDLISFRDLAPSA
ncbi:MAG TPA: ChbG/HpnK family deacetylase [Terracidiphilus sp.]|nr:ChbG/HpnK family deacetylase [Terracidiphilus sp.]